MKNNLFKTAFIISLVAIITTGCDKFDFGRHHEPVWQVSTSERQLGLNQTLEFVLPENMTKDVPVISTQAGQYQVSELVKDQIQGRWVYRYTPKAGFLGLDEVVIDSEDEKAEHADRQKGAADHHRCDHQGGNNHFRLNLKINIIDSIAVQ